MALGVRLQKAVQRVLRKRGYEIVDCRADIVDFLRSNKVDLVLDVGANVGQFSLRLRELGYAGRIQSFEPVGDVFNELASSAKHDPLWGVARSAVGAVPGQQSINVSDKTVFSSIKPLSSLGAEWHRSDVTSVETVHVETLDNLMRGVNAERIFLKIDTQGYEREVLDGATDTLNRVVGAQLELPVEQYYEGTWSIFEALEHMRALGFVPAQFQTVNGSRRDASSAGEIDCVFKFATEPPGDVEDIATARA